MLFAVLLFLLSTTSHGFIMSSADAVQGSKLDQFHSNFAIFFYGIEGGDEQLKEDLEKEITFPKKASMSSEEVFAWSLSRIPNIETILAGYGYFDAEVDFFVDVRSTPKIIYYNIRLGPLYTIGAFALRADPAHRGPVALMASDIEQFGVSLGMPANKHKILEAKENILRKLGESGFPFATITGEKTVLNRSKKSLLISFRIRANKLVRYGDVFLEGDSDIKPEFLQRFLNWDKGHIYNKAIVDQVAQELMDTGAFKEVVIYLDKQGKEMSNLTPEEIELEDDAPVVTVDIFFHLISKRAAMVRFSGASGDVGEAFGFEGTRFNKFQMGETFYLDALFSAERSHIMPRFLFSNAFGFANVQSLSSLGILSERFQGFSTGVFRAKQTFDYMINDHVAISVGGGLEYARYPEIRPSIGPTDTSITSFDVFGGIIANYLDSTIHPKSGWKAKALAIGSVGAYGLAYRMSRIKASLRFFTTLNARKSLVWENWTKIYMTPSHMDKRSKKTTPGNIPLHRMCYISGPKGLRGYRRQPFSLTPEDYILTPHYSMLTFGTQLNYYFSKNFSLSAYVDMGKSFEKDYPMLTWPLFYSLGGSARYTTSFGVFSMSLTTPLVETAYTNPVEFGIAFSPIWAD
ncbi:MAG: BamA/TamA family outer membrane protein [Alphaproteobacteria bacterium]|nr:BamA/TamA family outer membrane protein [Alphaproteobacteria bacterium]